MIQEKFFYTGLHYIGKNRSNSLEKTKDKGTWSYHPGSVRTLWWQFLPFGRQSNLQIYWHTSSPRVVTLNRNLTMTFETNTTSVMCRTHTTNVDKSYGTDRSRRHCFLLFDLPNFIVIKQDSVKTSALPVLVLQLSQTRKTPTFPSDNVRWGHRRPSTTSRNRKEPRIYVVGLETEVTVYHKRGARTETQV